MTELSPEAKSALKHVRFRNSLSPKERKALDELVEMARKLIKKGRGEEVLKVLRELN